VQQLCPGADSCCLHWLCCLHLHQWRVLFAIRGCQHRACCCCLQRVLTLVVACCFAEGHNCSCDLVRAGCFWCPGAWLPRLGWEVCKLMQCCSELVSQMVTSCDRSPQGLHICCWGLHLRLLLLWGPWNLIDALICQVLQLPGNLCIYIPFTVLCICCHCYCACMVEVRRPLHDSSSSTQHQNGAGAEPSPRCAAATEFDSRVLVSIALLRVSFACSFCSFRCYQPA
jgi:hypothetical protein